MSKLVNPWMCDNPSCGMLRAHDTNHWLVIERLRQVSAMIAQTQTPRLGDEGPVVLIHPWSEKAAQREGSQHACGVDCALRIIAGLIAENFFSEK